MAGVEESGNCLGDLTVPSAAGFILSSPTATRRESAFATTRQQRGASNMGSKFTDKRKFSLLASRAGGGGQTATERLRLLACIDLKNMTFQQKRKCWMKEKPPTALDQRKSSVYALGQLLRKENGLPLTTLELLYVKWRPHASWGRLPPRKTPWNFGGDQGELDRLKGGLWWER